MLLFRATCRESFSLSGCGRGCLTCEAARAADDFRPVDRTGVVGRLRFASLMSRHPRARAERAPECVLQCE